MERDLQPTIKEGEKGTAKQDPRGVGEDFTLNESKSEERQDTADVFSLERLAEPAQGLDSKSQGDSASEEAFFQAEVPIARELDQKSLEANGEDPTQVLKDKLVKSFSLFRDIEPSRYKVGPEPTSIEEILKSSPNFQGDEFVDLAIENASHVNGFAEDAKLEPGTELLLPGYRLDGGLVGLLPDGSRVTAWWSGGMKVESQDKTGKTEYSDGKVEPFDLNERDTSENAQSFEQEKEKFLKLAEDFDIGDSSGKDLDSIEKRVQSGELSEREAAKTLHEVNRMLEDKNGTAPLDDKARGKLAVQVLHQTAEPTLIDQGQHGTCSPASLENRLYSRTPSDAAKVVADVALTGSYLGANGVTVEVDPTPHNDSKLDQLLDGNRSHASEIFQVTAFNLHYKSENLVRGSNQEYRQLEKDPSNYGDTGEAVVDNSKSPPEVVRGVPGMASYRLAEVNYMITGRREENFILAHQDRYEGQRGAIKEFSNADEFQQAVKEAKANNNLPVVLTVHTAVEPFLSDSRAFPFQQDGRSHNLVVRDVTDGEPPKLLIDNQWSTEKDHLKPGTELDLIDVYFATRSPANAIGDMQKFLEGERAKGNPNFERELELVRLKQKERHYPSTDDFLRALADRAIDQDKHWQTQKQEGKLNEAERTEGLEKFKELFYFVAFDPYSKLPLSIELNQKGIFSDDSVDGDFTIHGAKLLREKIENPQNPDIPRREKIIQSVLAMLPEDRRVKVEAEMKELAKNPIYAE